MSEPCSPTFGLQSPWHPLALVRGVLQHRSYQRAFSQLNARAPCFQPAFTEFFNKIRMRADVPGRPAIHDYSGLIGGALIALGVVLLSIGELPRHLPVPGVCA